MKAKHMHREAGEQSQRDTSEQGKNGQNEQLAASVVGASAIAPLAYRYWQERGCPEGCSEEDWFRAERDLAAVQKSR
jgi:hypothetical protein